MRGVLFSGMLLWAAVGQVSADDGYLPEVGASGQSVLPRLAQVGLQDGDPNPDTDVDTVDPQQELPATDIGPSYPPGTSPAEVGARLKKLEDDAKAAREKLPLIKVGGFFHLDDGMFTQSAANMAQYGNIQNGLGFRRARLQAYGNVAEFTTYSIEMDFATVGRPSFMDVWGEQKNLPFFGDLRIGQFRQPTSMDGWTSIRHLEFLERSLPFQALDPFRRVGAMSHWLTEDEQTMFAYSVYGTGFTFWNPVNGTNNYGTLGDTRYGTQIGDSGGVSFALRGTHLLYYDEPSNGRYLLHVGGGYNYSQIGGTGTTGGAAKTYEARAIPEFFVGDPAAGGATAGGTPFVVDTGRFLADSFSFYHAELAGNYGSAHFQTEWMATTVNQIGGPQVFYHGGYAQCGYFLTGESVGYNKQMGAMDYNVAPFTEFFGIGRNRGMCGWGAWELAFRWSYIDLSSTNVVNYVGGSAGPPVSPNPGIVNDTTVALNWWWNQYTRVQFNWIHVMPDLNLTGTSNMDIFATRFQVEF